MTHTASPAGRIVRTTRHDRTTRLARTAALALCAAFVIAGCRGSESTKPPIHLNPNMDNQQKLKPQHESRFFDDGAAMRTPVEHTVARGELRADDAYYRGKLADGSYVDSPLGHGPDVVERGRQRYAIYCRPCHGDLGNGRGIVMDPKYKWPIPPPSYFEPRLMTAKDGYLFEVMSNGIRNMASYKSQVPVRDRWCIVSYVRELQKAQIPEADKNLQKPQQPQPATTAAK